MTQTELFSLLKSNHTEVVCQLKTRHLRKIRRPFIAVSYDVYQFLAPVPDALAVYMAFCAHTKDGYVTTPVTQMIEFCGLPRKRFYTALRFLRVVGLVMTAEEYLVQTGRPQAVASKRHWVVLDLTAQDLRTIMQSIAVKKQSTVETPPLFPTAPVQFNAAAMREKVKVVSPNGQNLQRQPSTVSTVKQMVFHRGNKKCFNGETNSRAKSQVEPKKSCASIYNIHKQTHRRYAATRTVRHILQNLPLTITNDRLQSRLTGVGRLAYDPQGDTSRGQRLCSCSVGPRAVSQGDSRTGS